MKKKPDAVARKQKNKVKSEKESVRVNRKFCLNIHIRIYLLICVYVTNVCIYTSEVWEDCRAPWKILSSSWWKREGLTLGFAAGTRVEKLISPNEVKRDVASRLESRSERRRGGVSWLGNREKNVRRRWCGRERRRRGSIWKEGRKKRKKGEEEGEDERRLRPEGEGGGRLQRLQPRRRRRRRRRRRGTRMGREKEREKIRSTVT